MVIRAKYIVPARIVKTFDKKILRFKIYLVAKLLSDITWYLINIILAGNVQFFLVNFDFTLIYKVFFSFRNQFRMAIWNSNSVSLRQVGFLYFFFVFLFRNIITHSFFFFFIGISWNNHLERHLEVVIAGKGFLLSFFYVFSF